MSDNRDSDYPRFVTCTGCGEHGYFRMNGKKTPDVDSKEEGRALLDASITSGEISEVDKSVLLPLLEASPIPEVSESDDLTNEKAIAQMFSSVFPSVDEFIEMLMGGGIPEREDAPGVATMFAAGFRMAPDTLGEVPHGSFYTQHEEILPVVFSKNDGRVMLENAKVMEMADEETLAQLLTDLEASSLPGERPKYSEFLAKREGTPEALDGACLVVCDCGSPITHAYYCINDEEVSLSIASKREGRHELFSLMEEGQISHYVHAALLVGLEESSFPDEPPTPTDRTPPNEASALFH